MKFRTQVFMMPIPFWRKIISYHIYKYIKHLAFFVSNFTNTSYNNGIYKRRICYKYHIKFKMTSFIWNSDQYNCYKTTYPLNVTFDIISHSESRLNVQAKTSFKVDNLDILLSWLIERKKYYNLDETCQYFEFGPNVSLHSAAL